MNNLIDTHVHFGDFTDPEKIKLEVVKHKLYTLSMTNLPEQYVELKKSFDIKDNKYLRFAIGYHPQEAGRHKFDSFLFTKYAPTTNYIGEVGLDFSKEYVEFSEEQIKVFSYICKLASKSKKLMSIHCVKAEAEVFSVLNQFNINTAIIHWYSGNISLASKMAKSGHYFSINEKMLRSDKGKELCKMLPSNKILVETDAPYTIKNADDYISKVERTYCSLKNYGISVEQIFLNFKELLESFN